MAHRDTSHVVLSGEVGVDIGFNPYGGFTPTSTRELANRYVGRLIPKLVADGPGNEGKHGLTE